jgi:hypothetical protein
MSLLTVIQSFCERTQLPVPATVIGTNDAQVKQVRALLEEEGEALSRRGDWEGLTFEATHTTLALEDQGAITSIATNGYRYIKDETMWDRTDKLPVPQMHSTKWQRFKAVVSAAPRYNYRIRGGKLLMTPTPTAGHTLAFEYVSKNWILGVDGTTYKSAFTLDTDTFLIPEELFKLGLRWRWKKEHGLEYAEDFRDYEMQVADALGRDGGKSVIYLDGGFPQTRPGVIVPEYNWPL